MKTIKFSLILIFIGFASNIQTYANNFKLLAPPTITILPLENSYCAGAYIDIAYEVSADFAPDNIFTAELSDENGNFDNPTEIGAINSSTSGIIPSQLPKNLIEANGYRIRIKATNPEVTSDDNGENIYIFALPDMTITGEMQPCRQNTYTYSTPSDFNYTYLWSVTGGYFVTDSTLNNVEIEWGVTDEFGYITLIKTNIQNGCKDTVIQQVDLQSPPLTQIIQGQSKTCIAEIAEYVAASTNNATGEWNVYGGTLLSNSDFRRAYVLWTQLGEGWIELVKFNEYGCVGRDTFFVNVYPVPYASITGSENVIENSTTKYKANKENDMMYQWIVEGGNIVGEDNLDSVIINWGAKGNGKVTLIEKYIGSGCSDTVEKEITILEALPDFTIHGKQTVCRSSLENYEIDIIPNVIIKWTVENGVIIGPDNDFSITVNWQNPGSGTVYCRLISTETNDTSNSDLEININELPQITIKGSLKFCIEHEPYELDFAKPEGGKYTGKGIIDNILYPDSLDLGKYTVSYEYTDSIGCSNSETVQIEIFPNPEKPEIWVKMGAFITNYKYGNIWYVEGEVFKENANDTLFFSEVPYSSYCVSVQHIDSNGCASSLSNMIEVAVPENPKPSVKIYPNPAEDYAIIFFENNKNQPLQMTISDVYGNILVEKIIDKMNNVESIKINLTKFANGIYFVKLQMGKGIVNKKLVIRR